MIAADLHETAANIRTHLLELLRTFASPNEQRSYQQAVPFIPVPTELLCGWANDLYHPESPAHALAFSPVEREALAAFDAELSRWADAISGNDVEVFIASAAGVALVGAATVALASLSTTQEAEPVAAPDPAR